MRVLFAGIPTLGVVTALAAAGVTELILVPAIEPDETTGQEPTDATITSTGVASSIASQGTVADLKPGRPAIFDVFGPLFAALMTGSCGDPKCEACAPAKAEPQPEQATGDTPGEPVTLGARDVLRADEVLSTLLNGDGVLDLEYVRVARDGLRGGTVEVPEVEASPKDVASKDARFDPHSSAVAMMDDVENGDVVAVALVGITSEGAVRLYSSESTGQTLNLLAQAIKVADGTLAPDDDDTPERIRSDD